MASSNLCGVLLANTGTPADPSPKAVRTYLAEFLMDPRICPMNRTAWWLILHLFILPSRGRKSSAKYEKIWMPEGAPLLVTHRAIEDNMQRAFDEAGLETLVRCGMSYGEPSIRSCLQQMKDEGCSRVVVLPMYPQAAYSTAGAVRGVFDRAMAAVHWDIPCEFVTGYSDNERYVHAVAQSILQAGFDPTSDDRLLFAYHSIPIVDIENGDDYELKTGSTSLAVAGELGIERTRWTIGYQCRFDKNREWLSPFVPEVLARWADSADEGRVFCVCPNFSVDCLETLYDIEMVHKEEYLDALRAAGKAVDDQSFIYVPCLNDSPAHTEVLLDVLKDHVR